MQSLVFRQGFKARQHIMSPAVKYWTCTVSGMVIFVIGLICWLGSEKNSTMFFVWMGVAEAGWLLYYVAAWIARCPECASPIFRESLLSDMEPECPKCGRNRYEARSDATR
jgi:hypothetical protein